MSVARAEMVEVGVELERSEESRSTGTHRKRKIGLTDTVRPHHQHAARHHRYSKDDSHHPRSTTLGRTPDRRRGRRTDQPRTAIETPRPLEQLRSTLSYFAPLETGDESSATQAGVPDAIDLHGDCCGESAPTLPVDGADGCSSTLT